MALMTHVQGSYSGFPVRTQPRAVDIVKLKPIVNFHLVGRANRSISSKQRLHLSIAGQYRLAPKRRQFKVLSFKGNAENEESEGIASASKFSKSSVKLSFVPQEKEETVIKSEDRSNAHFSYTSTQGEGAVGGSPAIQEIFKKWLIILRTQTASQTADEILKESPSQGEKTEPQHWSQQGGAGNLLKVLMHWFIGLDAAIKFPPLIFIPWYLAVSAVYGPAVSRELTPLWVAGPLIAAFYIKFIQGIVSFYVVAFKQTIWLVKEFPMLMETLWARLWQPVRRIQEFKYKEVSKQKMKELQEIAGEWYLDFVESIWPYYCRTVRFLKRSNLI